MNMKKESEMFDQMSDYYDLFRPDYPQEIIDSIVNHAKLSKGSRVLEVGAGSGKATARFVDYDLEMLCLDPGNNLVKKETRDSRERIFYLPKQDLKSMTCHTNILMQLFPGKHFIGFPNRWGMNYAIKR